MAADGSAFSLPKRWTSEAVPDPFDVIAQGRTHFRADDLVELVELLTGLGSDEGRATRPSDV